MLMNAINEITICKDQALEKKFTIIVYWDVRAVNKPVA